MKPINRTAVLILVSAVLFTAAEPYRKPPKAILDILNAPPTPTLSISPTRTYAMQGAPVRNPPIADLAQPMLGLGGIRINPRTNGLHTATFNTTLTLRKIPEGTEIKVDLPPDPKLSLGRWSPDSNRFAFTNTTGTGIELWVGETASGKTRKLSGFKINSVTGGRGGRGGGGSSDIQWLPDSQSLLVQTVPATRGNAPAAPNAPPGPNVQESLGGGRGARTFEDLLETPHDEELFEYYATSQLATVELAGNKVTPVGKPAIIESVRVSPDAKYLIVTSIRRPFSYTYPASSFPKEIEVWDRTGKVVHKVASIPMAGGGGGAAGGRGGASIPGTRSLQWRVGDPATLMWFEAVGPAPQNADPDAPGAAPRPDRIMTLKAPFTDTPEELFRTPQTISGLQAAPDGGLAIFETGGRGARVSQTYLANLHKPSEAPRLLFSRNPQDRYKDPGTPIQKALPNGQSALLIDGDHIFLSGAGASLTGDHPFLDRFNLATLKAERLFRSDDDHYETFEALLDPQGTRFLTRRESPTEPPNYFIRTAAGQLTALTKFPDPQPQLRSIQKQRVTYKREDGVDLSFVLYLPADYKPGTRLPTVVWAYPREFDDADVAGAVTGSTKRFTEIGGYSQLFFVLNGYAVLDNTAMPIVGDRRNVNDKFVEQVIMDAKAAVDKAVEMGWTDRNRVGVGGHSYGAFMTANLLAHSNIFKAGIAESGAYNRTLTPFGFQNERRTIWQAPEVYLKMSPFMHAQNLKAPILFIHGEADDNSGTFPVQSERMYQAVRGNGGVARLVFLPHEAHGYRARETVEHVLWEKFAWFDKYVKGVTTPATNN